MIQTQTDVGVEGNRRDAGLRGKQAKLKFLCKVVTSPKIVFAD